MPFFFFFNQLLLSGRSQRIVLGAAVVFGGAPLRPDPAHLLEFQQSGIDRALIEFKQIATHLCDSTGNSVAVQRSERRERFENEKSQRPGKDFMLAVAAHAISSC